MCRIIVECDIHVRLVVVCIYCFYDTYFLLFVTLVIKYNYAFKVLLSDGFSFVTVHLYYIYTCICNLHILCLKFENILCSQYMYVKSYLQDVSCLLKSL